MEEGCIWGAMHLSHMPNFYQSAERLGTEHFSAGVFCQCGGNTEQGDGEAFALLDQVKNPKYSQLEGREELFERS